MIVRHTTRLDLSETAGRVLISQPKLFLSLAVDHRRPTLFDGNVIRSLQSTLEVFRLGYVLAVSA
jgi:hypothetical protein